MFDDGVHKVGNQGLLLSCHAPVTALDEESGAPYAWRGQWSLTTSQVKVAACPIGALEPKTSSFLSRLGETYVTPAGPKWSQCLPPRVLEQASFQAMIQQAQTLDCIAFRLLPKKDALAGSILKHCVSVAGCLIEKHRPLIFKIGVTHNAVWRWENVLYGYGVARELWSSMVVMHISEEPYSVAMLEAALIDKFCRVLANQCKATHHGTGFAVYPNYIYRTKRLSKRSSNETANKPFLHMAGMQLGSLVHDAFQGEPGCKNVRAGGENIKLPDFLEGPSVYMCYFVYRSFKNKPVP